MTQMSQFLHKWWHGVGEFWHRMGIAPENPDDNQEDERGGNIFMQFNDIAFKAAICFITQKVTAIKTNSPGRYKNNCHKPVQDLGGAGV